jgi:hypothetical protein
MRIVPVSLNFSCKIYESSLNIDVFSDFSCVLFYENVQNRSKYDDIGCVFSLSLKPGP